MATILLLLPGLPAAGATQTPQWLEDSAHSTSLSLTLTSSSTRDICETGATWLRLGVADVQLGDGDSIRFTGSSGDSLVLAGPHWNGRRFHTRALRGNCIEVRTSFSGSGSRLVLEDRQAGSLPLDESTTVLAGAGDICDYTPVDCGRTADLIVAINPTAAFASGDNVYNHGSLAQYRERYAPNWGRFKDITLPVPGNHEYWTTGAEGYFDYFNGVGEDTGPAGERGHGYYSVDIGEWHVVALNTRVGGTMASSQLAWLDADLAANTKPCTLALFHHPLASVGEYAGYASIRPVWDRLYAARADLVVVGHDHNYQRWAPMDSSLAARSEGPVQLVVGTGGANPYALGGTHPRFVRGQGTTHGVLRLTLSPVGYVGRFVPVAGSSWTDSFSAGCHSPAPAPVATGDFALSSTASMAVAPGRSGGKLINVASLDGFSSAVQLSVSGLPSDVTPSFEANPVTPPADGSTSSRLVLRAASNADSGSYTVVVRGQSGSTAHTTSFLLLVR